MKKNCAFTLIETIVATAAMAVLAVCVLTVITHVARADARRAATEADTVSDLQRLIAQDLRVATSAALSEHGDRLTMTGHGWIDPTTQQLTGRDADVEYVIETIGTAKMLWRRQSRIEQRGTRRDSNIVALGVESFALEKPSATTQLNRNSKLSKPEYTGIRLLLQDGRVSAWPLAVTLQ